MLLSKRRHLHSSAIAAVSHSFKACVHNGEGEAVHHGLQEVVQDSAGKGVLGLLQVRPAGVQVYSQTALRGSSPPRVQGGA